MSNIKTLICASVNILVVVKTLFLVLKHDKTWRVEQLPISFVHSLINMRNCCPNTYFVVFYSFFTRFSDYVLCFSWLSKEIWFSREEELRLKIRLKLTNFKKNIFFTKYSESKSSSSYPPVEVKLIIWKKKTTNVLIINPSDIKRRGIIQKWRHTISDNFWHIIVMPFST